MPLSGGFEIRLLRLAWASGKRTCPGGRKAKGQDCSMASREPRYLRKPSHRGEGRGVSIIGPYPHDAYSPSLRQLVGVFECRNPQTVEVVTIRNSRDDRVEKHSGVFARGSRLLRLIIHVVEGTDLPVRATLSQLGMPRSTF